jgi:hypothetical protein
VTTTQVRAADAAPAAVDPAKLAAFMEKWKGFGPRNNYPEAEADQPLLLVAMAKDPTGPWWIYLSHDIILALSQLPASPAEERQRAVAQVVDLANQAEKVSADAAVQDVTNREFLLLKREQWQQLQASWILEAGPQYLPYARALGQAMLAKPQTTNALSRGDLIYAGNQLLGRVALREGKLPEARDYLLKAGQAPATPALKAVGPNNVLVGELLRHGEPEDRKAVLAYLDAIAHFWRNPLPNSDYEQRRAFDQLERLAEWKETIRAGHIPPEWQRQ